MVGGSTKVGVAVTVVGTASRSTAVPGAAVCWSVAVVPAKGVVDAFVTGTRRCISHGEVPVVTATKVAAAFGKDVGSGRNLVASAI